VVAGLSGVDSSVGVRQFRIFAGCIFRGGTFSRLCLASFSEPSIFSFELCRFRFEDFLDSVSRTGQCIESVGLSTGFSSFFRSSFASDDVRVYPRGSGPYPRGSSLANE